MEDSQYRYFGYETQVIPWLYEHSGYKPAISQWGIRGIASIKRHLGWINLCQAG